MNRLSCVLYSDRCGRASDAFKPHPATAARNNEIRTSYPASETPRKRQAASSHRTILMSCSCFSRSPAEPKLLIGPEQSFGPAQNFHSTRSEEHTSELQ